MRKKSVHIECERKKKGTLLIKREKNGGKEKKFRNSAGRGKALEC